MSVRHLRAIALGVLSIVLVVACAAPVAPAQALLAQPPISADEVVDDIDTAVAVTDGYWKAHWAEHFTGAYESPTVVGLFDGTDPDSAPTCDLGAGPVVLGPDNAFYCGPEDFLAWDTTFMERAFEVGDTFVYLVVAHEWGHAIANRLDGTLQAQAAELQADCFAGAAIYGAVQDGTLVLEQGDEREITRGLTDLADETAWTMVADHGDPFQRIESFNAGRTQGPTACLPGS